MSDKTSSWADYVQDLAKFTRLSKLRHKKSWAELHGFEDRLIAGATCLSNAEQRATALEEATIAGSLRLLEALPAVGSTWIAHLDADQWRQAALKCDARMLRIATSKGLALPLDWPHIKAVIMASSTNRSALPFVLEDVAQTAFHFAEVHAYKNRWLGIRDSALAAEYLRHQVSHHPTHALSLQACLGGRLLPLSAALELAGASFEQDPSPKALLVESQPTAHAKLEISEIFSSLEHAHAHIRKTMLIADRQAR